MTVAEFKKIPKLFTQIKSIVSIKNRGKYKKEYLELYCGFDIETTNIYNNKTAYMYHFQFIFNNYVVTGRKWCEFIDLIAYLITELHLTHEKRLIVAVANLGFEFQFFRKYFQISELFAKELRHPLYFLVNDCVEFHDVLAISGGNLAYLAKNYCKTQKMIGDLDYNVLRNSQTELTEKETHYCYNDVIILSEYMEYLFNNFIKPLKFMPITKTGILRKQVKKLFPYRAKDIIKMCYPDYATYCKWFKYLFRGGFVHTNILYVDQIICDIGSVDFTSSYPAQMIYNYYPVSPFINQDSKKVFQFIKTHCCIIHCIFYNLKSKTQHSIESSSKVINLVNPIIDNGRVQSADVLEVLLTEIDFKIYMMFYQFNKFEIVSLQTSVRGCLPNYLLDPLKQAYEKKNNLKNQGLSNTIEYAQAKSDVNSFYGLTVTRMVTKEIKYEKNEWILENNFDFNKEVSQAFLLPQWGVWITAHARFALLQQVHKIEKRAKKLKIKKGGCIYCDTDSIKVQHFDYYKDIFQNYNNQIDQKLLKSGLDKKFYYTLGKWDIEFKSRKGKFLGAKRYIITNENNETKVTVAGLPKKALPEYCKNNNLDIYNVFSDKMLLKCPIALKNAVCYNDEEHHDKVLNEIMKEKSSCCIYPIDFTMNLSSAYVLLYYTLQQKNQKFEERTE